MIIIIQHSAGIRAYCCNAPPTLSNRYSISVGTPYGICTLAWARSHHHMATSVLFLSIRREWVNGSDTNCANALSIAAMLHASSQTILLCFNKPRGPRRAAQAACYGNPFTCLPSLADRFVQPRNVPFHESPCRHLNSACAKSLTFSHA